MFSHHFDETPDLKVVLQWYILCFNGGCINAGGFLATGKFVSHVTGFATLFGVSITKGEIEAAMGLLSVPLFFLVGAFVAGLLIDHPIHNGRRPHFDWVMGLCALCLFLAAAGGEFLLFGSFNEVVGLKRNYLLLALLCLASGLQNGAITSSSGKSVRTTHLTGLTTDLGLGLARIFTFNFKQGHFKKEARANYLRLGSILSFVVGSAIGAWVFIRMGYLGFIFPGIVAGYAAWHGRKSRIAPHIATSLEKGEGNAALERSPQRL